MKKEIREYENYIFDLYGTLIDIHTDEEKPELWEKICDYLKENFNVEYSHEELRKRYIEICGEEEKKLQKENGADFPEITIENVWKRLIDEKNEQHRTFDISKVRELCIYFRETSRDKFEVYEGVYDTLKTLKDKGKGVFLLSNAQRAFTEKELNDAKLTEYFDEIFISSDKAIKKPQKEFLELLMKENHLNFDKCVMIGNDIFSDVGVAVRNGVHSVFLNTYDYSDKKIDRELTELGIKGSELMPVIVGDGDIRKIINWQNN